MGGVTRRSPMLLRQPVALACARAHAQVCCEVIHPESEFHKKWDSIQVFALLYVALLVRASAPVLALGSP